MSKKIHIPPVPNGLRQCKWTDDALKLINERYLRRDTDGNIFETVEDMCWRVAYHIALADKKFGRSDEEVIELAKEFYHLFADRKFFPNAPTLYNAGTGNGLQFSACFVLPVEDSIDGIYDAIKWQAIIHKSGGGTGFSFSSLRPKDAIVKTTRAKSSGPVSFLKIFNTSTEFIKQGGMRRGANMAIMRVDHPDILEFIQCKSVLTDKNKITFDRMKPSLFTKLALDTLKISLLETQIANFNISVAATDVFMKAVKEDTTYDLIDPQNNQVVGSLCAREIFSLIVNMAWETGDPGLWFVDRTNQSRANPIPTLKTINATNPCGEQPLFDFDVCNLGSINLANFVTKTNGQDYQINWKELERVVRLAVHFLDNVIEMNPYPLPQIMDLAHKIRRIGLGVMGWADMLAYLNVSYSSKEACKVAEELSKFINDVGHDESHNLAEQRGAFPLWDQSIYKDEKPIRNCTITTIAPTGEIRILAGCSGGIEPYYGLTEVHRFENRTLHRIQPGFTRFIEVAKERGFFSGALEEEVKNHGRIGDLDGIPEDVKRVFITAHEIEAKWHVRMQAAFQKNTDNGVSKTINFPNSATPDDVEEVYWMAYETGCLGITVFRDGCKGQVLSIGVGEKTKEVTIRDFVKSRPNHVFGSTIKVETPDGAAFITVNFDSESGPSEPFEIFVNVAKAGTDATADAEAIGRMASMLLRTESPKSSIERLVQVRDQLKGIGGSRASGFGKDKVISLPDGISKAIDIYLKCFGFVDDVAIKEKETTLNSGNRCPKCKQSALIYEEGCIRCSNCDYNVC